MHSSSEPSKLLLAHLASEAAKVVGGVHWPNGRASVLARHPQADLPPDGPLHVYVELPKARADAQDRVEAVARLHGYHALAYPVATGGVILQLTPVTIP